MKLYFIAGERSGDLHGGNLIEALRQLNPGIRCRGFGGEAMRDAGMELVVHYRHLSYMGFAEVIRHLPAIASRLRQCREDILTWKPDALVLIDFAGFNLRMARFARKRGIKVFWYIAPKVWAWNAGRVRALRAAVDRLFVILPFEKEFFESKGLKVHYVGNPVMDAVKNHRPDRQFMDRYGFQSDRPLIALLPGSRRQEVVRMVPVLADVVRHYPLWQFGVAVVDNLPASVYKALEGFENVRLVRAITYDLLLHAGGAVVTSGTATLETALFGIPQVVVYRTSALNYAFGRMLIRVPHISLVNLIAGREVVREFIQQEANAKTIGSELDRILKGENYRAAMVAGYQEIQRLLDTGSASANTARLMLQYLEDR